ncbi:MAG TPA: GNAT family N-acetyltransferase [Phycisphaerales bacterium]
MSHSLPTTPAVSYDPAGRPVLRTARLTLSAMEPSDAPAIASLAGDKRVFDKTLLIPHPYELRHAHEWIASHATQWQRWKQDWTANWAIRLDGAMIGAIGLVGAAAHRRAELGYWVGAPHWGNGYASEAAAAVVAFARDVLGAKRLEAGVFVGNEASRRVLQKCGMREECIRRARYIKNGVHVDEHFLAVVFDG